MERVPFSSKDFAQVPATLISEAAPCLVDREVSQPRDDGLDQPFSRERHHFVRAVDVPSRAISMTIGGLAPGQSTRMHRHNYETIIYVVSGRGTSVVGDQAIAWRAGDAFYVPVWAWHRHSNTSEDEEVLYVACENAPLLQNLGVAVREEA